MYLTKLECLGKVSKQVEYILQTEPKTRNSDKLLIVRVLQEFYGVTRIEEIIKSDLPSMESIRRFRQKLQHDGLYLSSDEVKDTRFEMQNNYQFFLGGNK